MRKGFMTWRGPKQVGGLSSDMQIVVASDTELGRAVSSMLRGQAAQAAKVGWPRCPDRERVGGDWVGGAAHAAPSFQLAEETGTALPKEADQPPWPMPSEQVKQCP